MGKYLFFDWKFVYTWAILHSFVKEPEGTHYSSVVFLIYWAIMNNERDNLLTFNAYKVISVQNLG